MLPSLQSEFLHRPVTQTKAVVTGDLECLVDQDVCQQLEMKEVTEQMYESKSPQNGHKSRVASDPTRSVIPHLQHPMTQPVLQV